MKDSVYTAICLLICMCLLGTAFVDGYICANDILLELSDSDHENPTEDCKDSEMEFEVNILSDRYPNKNLSLVTVGLIGHESILLSDYCKDIPIPPPDLA